MNKNDLLLGGGFAILIAVFATTFLGCLFLLEQIMRMTLDVSPIEFFQ